MICLYYIKLKNVSVKVLSCLNATFKHPDALLEDVLLTQDSALSGWTGAAFLLTRIPQGKEPHPQPGLLPSHIERVIC